MATFPVNIAPGTYKIVEPQAFYAQTYVLQPPAGVAGYDNTFRPPLKGLPEQPYRPDFTWTVNLLQNTLAPVVANPFFQTDWPNPTQPFRADQTWTWQYNLNLIGQDALIVGDQRYDLPPIWPPYINVLRTWNWSYNLNLIGRDRLPTGEQIYDLTAHRAAPQPIEQTWTWRYNLNLIGKDQLPTGEQVSDLAPAQKPYEQQQLHSWQWTYNLNLIGQDRMLVGEQVWERPTLPIPPSALTWTQAIFYEEIKPFLQSDWPLPTQPYRIEQTWTWAYNKNLIGKDQLPPGADVWDLAPAQKPYEQTQLHSWQWSYNLNLIGQDARLIGQQYWERPQLPVPPTQSWTDLLKIWLTAPVLNITISQYWDRPALPIPPAQTWSWSYNLNLIGQDRMVTGQQTTELPPRDFARLFQTWINTVNLALVTAPPDLTKQVHLFDYPNPRGLEPDWRRSWEWQYNKNLIGQDALPFRQQDWPNPLAAQQAAQTWIDQTKIALTTPTLIIRQSDWPVPTAPQQPAQSWTSWYNFNLIGQDQLPNRQQDWPLTPAQGRSADLSTWINRVQWQLFKPFAQTDWPNPTPFARDPTLTTIAASYNKNLIGQDRLPNRQQDWPLSDGHRLAQIPLQVMVAGNPFYLIPPVAGPLGVLFNNYDWPLPRGYPPIDQSTTFRDYFLQPPPVSALPPLRTLMGTGV
jgi:hypothetical protein